MIKSCYKSDFLTNTIKPANHEGVGYGLLPGLSIVRQLSYRDMALRASAFEYKSSVNVVLEEGERNVLQRRGRTIVSLGLAEDATSA